MSRAFRVKGLNALTRRGRRMHLSYATEKSYAGWAQSYIRALPKYPTAWPSEKKAEAFLTSLAQRDVAAATQNQALSLYFLDTPESSGTLGEGKTLKYRRSSQGFFFPP